MLTLTVYPPHFSEPSASPFCVKSMCMLQLANIVHEIEVSNDPRKAPKAKLPMLTMDGSVAADSDIIRDIIEKQSGFDFDAGLTVEQRGTSRAVIRMMEEHLYFAIVCDRWGNDANWQHVKAAFFGDIPAVLRGVITRHVRKQALGQLEGQGMGRFDEQERFQRVKKDVIAVKNLVGDRPFIFGDDPTASDISAVAMLAAARAAPVPTDLSDLINQDTTLVSYIERGREAFYPT